jgi:hypothetical protein
MPVPPHRINLAQPHQMQLFGISIQSMLQVEMREVSTGTKPMQMVPATFSSIGIERGGNDLSGVGGILSQNIEEV